MSNTYQGTRRLTGRTKPARALADAMDAAERRGETIPCKGAPEAWTSDVVTEQGPYSRVLVAELIAGCHTCPVLAECTVRREAAAPGELYGVVAGRLMRPNAGKSPTFHGMTRKNLLDALMFERFGGTPEEAA